MAQGAGARTLHPALSPPEAERVFGVDWGRWDVRREERSRWGRLLLHGLRKK